MKVSKILLVDDDKDLVSVVKDWLIMDNHIVEVVEDGKSALEQLGISEYDLVILDWGLPLVSGIEVLQQYRGRGGLTPILMLTGKGEIEEKATGLDQGADDYLTKPFHMVELSARLRALLRRASGQPSNVLKVGQLELEHDTHHVLNAGEKVVLPPREFALLEFLMRHPNQVFSADALLERLWHSDADIAPETVRACVKRLRKKLNMEADNSMIQTLHGVGYRLLSGS